MLVGVDLNSVETFWERNPLYLSNIGIVKLNSHQNNAVHKISDPLYKRFTVLETIPILASYANKHFGINIYVEDPNSSLARKLPVYKW